MKVLKIPNTRAFHNIVKIQEAVDLSEKIKAQAALKDFDAAAQAPYTRIPKYPNPERGACISGFGIRASGFLGGACGRAGASFLFFITRIEDTRNPKADTRDRRWTCPRRSKRRLRSRTSTRPRRHRLYYTHRRYPKPET